MADFKNRTLVFSTGKQIKVESGCIAVRSSMELAEGLSRDIFYSGNQSNDFANNEEVNNVYQLTRDELIELADCEIKLWKEFKEQIKKYGENSGLVFY